MTEGALADAAKLARTHVRIYIYVCVYMRVCACVRACRFRIDNTHPSCRIDDISICRFDDRSFHSRASVDVVITDGSARRTNCVLCPLEIDF